MFWEMIPRSAYLDAIDSVNAALVIVQDTGEIVFATRLAEHLFGCNTVGGLTTKKVEELIPEALRENHVALRSKYEPTLLPRAMVHGRWVTARRLDGIEIDVGIGLGSVIFAAKVCIIANIFVRGE